MNIPIWPPKGPKENPLIKQFKVNRAQKKKLDLVKYYRDKTARNPIEFRITKDAMNTLQELILAIKKCKPGKIQKELFTVIHDQFKKISQNIFDDDGRSLLPSDQVSPHDNRRNDIENLCKMIYQEKYKTWKKHGEERIRLIKNHKAKQVRGKELDPVQYYRGKTAGNPVELRITKHALDTLQELILAIKKCKPGKIQKELFMVMHDQFKKISQNIFDGFRRSLLPRDQIKMYDDRRDDIEKLCQKIHRINYSDWRKQVKKENAS